MLENWMKNLAALFVIGAFTTGCAFTVYDVNVDYQYDQPVSEKLEGTKIEVIKFTDGRDVENSRMIMNQKNGYGQTTSGGWQAEKPLSEILQDAVVDGLSDANTILDPSVAAMQLSGELLEVNTEIIMGVWKGSYKGKITAKFQLKDKDSGDILWRDTFVGSGQVKGGDGVVTSFTIALDDLVNDLLNDEYFLSKISSGRDTVSLQ